MTISVSTTLPGGQPVTVTGKGVFDGQEADVTADVSSLLAAAGAPAGAGGQIELRYLQENGDPVIYVNVPLLAAMLPAGRRGSGSISSRSATGRARREPAAGRGDHEPRRRRSTCCTRAARSRRSARRRSTGCHHALPCDVEPEKAAAARRALAESRTARLIAAGAPASIPVDVWIGADGLVRRASINETAAVGSQATDVHAQVDISDYGTPVSVTAPPADQVFDLTGLASNLAAGLAATLH